VFAAAVLVATAPLHAQRARPNDSGVWGANVRLVEEVRIGALEGADEYLFGRIVGVASGHNGAIYVADGEVPIIRMYDARGKFIRNLGRSGGGPGEYRAIGGIRTLRDGHLALWDNRSQRITVYNPNGEYVRSHPVPSGLFAADVFEVDHAGHFYVRTMVRFDHDRGGDLPQGWIRVSPAGTVLDTIPIPDDPNKAQSFVLSTPSGYDRPFPRETVSTISRMGYLISGRNDAYKFQLHPNRKPGLTIERAYTPIRVAQDERAEWEAWAAFFQRRATNPPGRGPAVVGPRPAAYSIPQTKPPFSELRTDADGRIWVRRYVEAQRRPATPRRAGNESPQHLWREPPTFDVFEPAGRFLGTVTLPWSSFFYDASDRFVWAGLRGDLDEAYVVRYRLDFTSR
jgi:hypothetical protein